MDQKKKKTKNHDDSVEEVSDWGSDYEVDIDEEWEEDESDQEILDKSYNAL